MYFSDTQCDVADARQLAIYLKQDADGGEVALLGKGNETTQAGKASPRPYEIGNVALTGLGAVDNESIVYRGRSKCEKKAKNRNVACPGAKVPRWKDSHFRQTPREPSD